MEIRISYPELPLTVNHAYVTVRGSHRVLKTEGKRWKRKFHEFLWDEHGEALDKLLTAAGDTEWLMTSYHFYFRSLVNETYMQRHKTSLPARTGKRKGKVIELPAQVKGERKSQERFKRIDGSNRLKLVEDALSESLEMDDCRFQTGAILKYMDPGQERTELFIEVVNPADFGVPEEYVRDPHGTLPGPRSVRG